MRGYTAHRHSRHTLTGARRCKNRAHGAKKAAGCAKLRIFVRQKENFYPKFISFNKKTTPGGFRKQMQRPSEVVEHLREKGKLATFSIVSRLTYPTDGGTRRQMPAHRKHGICVVQTRHLRIVNTAFALCKHGICTMQTRHLHNVNTAFAHRQLFSSGGGIREWVLTIRRRVVGISQPAVTKGAEPCVTHGTRVCQNWHTLVLLLM